MLIKNFLKKMNSLVIKARELEKVKNLGDKAVAIRLIVLMPDGDSRESQFLNRIIRSFNCDENRIGGPVYFPMGTNQKMMGAELPDGIFSNQKSHFG
jgi:hypothetical protein